MPHYRCEICSAIQLHEQLPETCDGCNLPASEAFPHGPVASDASPRDSVEDLFDLGPSRDRPAMLGTAAPSPVGPPASGSATDESDPEDVPTPPLLTRTTEEIGDSPGPQQESSPRPDPEGEKPLETPISDRLASTLPDQEDQAATSAVQGGPLVTSTTLELDEDDLQAGAPPPTPGPLLARSTLELDEKDLEPVPATSKPPSPPAAESALPLITIKPRNLRGRVAFPLGTVDQTPLPRTLPLEVNELAVAGEPPRPPRQRHALSSQTEQLRSIKSRRRHQTLLSWVGAAILAGVVITAGVLLSRRPAADPPPLVNPDAGRPVVAGHPDLRPPDLRPLDLRPLDLPRRDQPASDSQRRGPRGRGPIAASGSRGPGAPGKPDDARPSAAQPTGDEAKPLYQEGLQRLLRGETSEAVRLFNAALAKSPGFSLAYRGLGLAYEKLGRAEMARAAFKRYLILQPNAADAVLIQKRIEGLKGGEEP